MMSGNSPDFTERLRAAGLRPTRQRVALARVLFEGGQFDSTDAVLVWFVLAAYAVGLPAIGTSRLLQNTCYAVGDTRGPARISAVRVAVSAVVGVAVMFPLERVVVGPDGLVALSGAWTSFGPLDASIRAVEGPVRLGAVGLAARCMDRTDAVVHARSSSRARAF